MNKKTFPKIGKITSVKQFNHNNITYEQLNIVGGKGASKIIYLGLDKTNKQLVMLNYLNNFNRLIKNEIMILYSLNNPYILKFIDYYCNVNVLIMEYVPGGSAFMVGKLATSV